MPSDSLTLLTKSLPWLIPFFLRRALQRLSALWHGLTCNETTNPKHVVVIGNSFAGLQLVSRLAESLPTGYKVLWIEKNSHLHYCFAFPRFSVLPGFEKRAFIPYSGVEGVAPRGILERVQARAVDVADGSVRLEDGLVVEYEYLVIATGSTRPVPGQVHSTGRAEGCDESRAVQGVIRESQRIAVVGAGALGMELAADIKDVYPEKEVTLVHSRSQVLNRFGGRLQEYALDALRELDVRVLLNERPRVPDEGGIVKSAALVFSDGREEVFDLVITCTGQTPNSSILSSLHPSAIAKATSQILVRPTLQVFVPEETKTENAEQQAQMRIFAVGDVAAHPGPLMARTGYIQADTVVSNVLSLTRGQEAKAIYKPNWFVEGGIKLTLGRKHNVVYTRDEDGTEVLISSKGREDMDVGRAWKQIGGLIEYST